MRQRWKRPWRRGMWRRRSSNRPESTFGQVPLRPEFLHTLRRLTERAGALLILDEVVTGFRVSPGGAQVAFGVRPDLSSFAKIVAGGLPGAAVAGRADVMDRLDFAASARTGQEKVQHPGTFNANPVSAAAGTAALTVIAESDVNARADATARDLRAALNEVLAEQGISWAVYGTSSGFHLFMNPRGRKIVPGQFDAFAVPREELKEQPKRVAERLRLALLNGGIDVNGRIGGMVSATHGAAEINDTARALRAALGMLRAEGEITLGAGGRDRAARLFRQGLSKIGRIMNWGIAPCRSVLFRDEPISCRSGIVGARGRVGRRCFVF